jgi:hypothetical protein
VGCSAATRGLEGCYLVRGAINPPQSNLPRSRNGRRDRGHSICEKAPGNPYSAPAGRATHPSGSLETAPAGFSESARSIEGKGKRRTVGAMRRFRGRTGKRGAWGGVFSPVQANNVDEVAWFHSRVLNLYRVQPIPPGNSGARSAVKALQ